MSCFDLSQKRCKVHVLTKYIIFCHILWYKVIFMILVNNWFHVLFYRTGTFSWMTAGWPWRRMTVWWTVSFQLPVSMTWQVSSICLAIPYARRSPTTICGCPSFPAPRAAASRACRGSPAVSHFSSAPWSPTPCGSSQRAIPATTWVWNLSHLSKSSSRGVISPKKNHHYIETIWRRKL